jgi:hypothetical protein
LAIHLLVGYWLKFFKDSEFKSEFISAGDSRDFNVLGIGTIGIGTASISIKYSENLPLKLFYALEKSGYISTADKDVYNCSQTNYIEQ